MAELAIASVEAWEILDSRGLPTIEVEVRLAGGARGAAAVPSDASTGRREAVELRDGDPGRFAGKGVQRAVRNVIDVIGPALRGCDANRQPAIDRRLCDLDGTANKSRLGANAMLGVSMAVARAAAAATEQPLYRYLGGSDAALLPVPMLNVINGGRHAVNRLDLQEFTIIPHGAPTFVDSMRMAVETYQALRAILVRRKLGVAVGDEGGFAPELRSHDEALEVLVEAIEAAHYRPGEQIAIAVDAAASEFFAEGRYVLARSTGRALTSAEMVDLYRAVLERFPVLLLEDGLGEDDWRELGTRVQRVGDDVLVTNPTIIRRAIAERVANSVLIKLNQIGTVTETLEAVAVAGALALADLSPDDASAELLLIGLGSPDVACRAECERALAGLGKRAARALRVAALTAAVPTHSLGTRRLHGRARRRAIALLRAAAPDDFACRGLLQDDDPAVRYEAARGLARLEHARRGGWRAAVARDPDPRVRAVATEALDGDGGGSRRSWLNRNVVGMSLTSLLSDAGHEMATAILPAFLATLGVSAAGLGAIEGVADTVASFAKLGSGWWSDRIGHRKAIAVGGYALTGAAKALFALAAGWPLVLTGRVLAWFGRGIRGSLRDAMLVESVEPADVGKAFGFHRAGDTIGAVVGPLLGVAAIGLLHGRFADPSMPFRVAFLLTLVPGLGSALAFALMVREQRRAPNHELRFWRSIRGLPRAYRRFLVGVFVFGLADFAPTLLILRATDLLAPVHGVARAAQLAALLYALRNALYAGAAFPVGALADRIGRRGLLASGYAIAALTFVGFMHSSTELWYLALLFAAAGVFMAAEDALEGAIAAELLPAPTRGLGYGVLGTVNGIGDLFSSVIVGLLWAHVSVAAGLAYAAVLSVVGAALILRVR
jgi:enolase